MKIGKVINKFDIWIANLNPSRGIEVGKVRPCLIVQTDSLNKFHPTILVCPISSNPWSEKTNHFLVPKGTPGIESSSVILLDQIRALDRSRLIEKIGYLTEEHHNQVNQSLKIILDLI